MHTHTTQTCIKNENSMHVKVKHVWLSSSIFSQTKVLHVCFSSLSVLPPLPKEVELGGGRWQEP